MSRIGTDALVDIALRVMVVGCIVLGVTGAAIAVGTFGWLCWVLVGAAL